MKNIVLAATNRLSEVAGPAEDSQSVVTWLTALGIPIVTGLVQATLWHILEPFAWYLFYPVVFVVAMLTGMWGGTVATILSACIIHYAFLKPYYSFHIDNPLHFLYGVGFTITGIGISWFHEKRIQLSALVAEQQQELQQHHIEQALEMSERRYETVLLSANEAIITVDSMGLIVAWNPGATRIFGWAVDEALGQTLMILIPERYRYSHVRGFNRRMFGGESKFNGKPLEVRGCHKDCHEFDLELSMSQWSDKHGRFVTAIIRDISDRKLAERALHESRKKLEDTLKRESQLNRSLRLLVDCNFKIVTSKSERELLDGVCRLMIEVGGYNMAWVGYAQDDGRKSVLPVAASGYEKEYIDGIDVTWDENNPTGRGPAGLTLRSGITSFFLHARENSNMVPWRERLIAAGCDASIALSIKGVGNVRGVLLVYSADSIAFEDPMEVALLEEVARNVSYGLSVLDEITQRVSAEEANKAKSVFLSQYES